MKMYKGQFEKIEEVEVERITDKFVVFKNGNRDSKDTDWRWYRESKEVVKALMIEHAMRKIATHEKVLNYEKEKLEKIKAL